MSVYEFGAKAIDGVERSMQDFRNQVLLIVNVASRCGFTPQYTGLEALYRKLHPRGFSVLGFPCDQFGHQEPAEDAQIKTFCSLTYEVTFPMFAKIDVNGPNAHSIYKFLKHEQPGVLGSEGIKWNFTKFLIDRAGRVRKRYGPMEKPESIESHIELLLSEPMVT
jgi:glutathione peroxidase